jgi:hypothetical protein
MKDKVNQQHDVLDGPEFIRDKIKVAYFCSDKNKLKKKSNQKNISMEKDNTRKIKKILFHSDKNKTKKMFYQKIDGKTNFKLLTSSFQRWTNSRVLEISTLKMLIMDK